MRPGEYFKTEEGQAYLHDKRKMERIYASAEHEPKSKKAFRSRARTEDKRAFQAEASKWMGLLDLTPLRGPVVVDMSFHPVGANPPSIEKLPKSYLDLLERRVGTDGSFTNERLVFQNDRQVKMLMVRYSLGLAATPQVSATVTARRHFVADLELVRRIERGDFEEPRDFGHRRWRDREHDRSQIFGHEHGHKLEDALEHLRELNLWPQKARVDWGEGAFERMRSFYRHCAQQALLGDSDRFIGSLLLDLPELWKRRPREWLMKFASSSRGLLVSRPVSFSVGHAPRREGDTTMFAEALQRALGGFMKSYPLLFPLLTQLSVTIFHVPPLPGRDGTDGKDLDNLARLIIPKVKEVFRPPSTIWHAHQTFAVSSSDSRISDWARTQTEIHRRIPAIAVSRYCAIELPRVPGDPRDGEVALAFGDGQQIESLWDQIDDFVGDWERSLRG
jgi:hypothetical protein